MSVAPVAPVSCDMKAEFAYDWRMRRIAKKTFVFTSGTWALQETTRYKYREWNPIEETVADASGTITAVKRYVWGNDLSGNMDGAGGVGGLLSMSHNVAEVVNTYFHAYDGNGNVRALVKADALNPAASAIVERYAYDGFGRELAGGAPLATSVNGFRFSTKMLDAETGMNYYGYRYYASADGRWINRDLIAEKGGLNVYGMVGNDAIFSIDVLGMVDFGPILNQILNGKGCAGLDSVSAAICNCINKLKPACPVKKDGTANPTPPDPRKGLLPKQSDVVNCMCLASTDPDCEQKANHAIYKATHPNPPAPNPSFAR